MSGLDTSQNVTTDVVFENEHDHDPADVPDKDDASASDAVDQGPVEGLEGRA